MVGFSACKAERLQTLGQPLEGFPGRRPHDGVDISGDTPGLTRDENPWSTRPDDDEGQSLIAQHR